jgi:hypothetical protein
VGVPLDDVLLVAPARGIGLLALDKELDSVKGCLNQGEREGTSPLAAPCIAHIGI